MKRQKLKKNFWKKILFMNIAFLLIVVLIFTLFRYNTSIRYEKENIHRMLDELSENESRLFSTMLNDMARLSYNLAISHTTLTTLKNADAAGGPENYFTRNRSARKQLMLYIQQMAGNEMKNTSVNILSSKGDYVLLDLYNTVSLDREEILSISKQEQFQGSNLFKFITSLEPDPYGRTDVPMFSFVRKISDAFGNYGYVEIQKTRTAIDQLFHHSTDNFGMISILAFSDSLFYSSDSRETAWTEALPLLSENGSLENTSVRLTDGTYFVHRTALDSYGFTLYTLLPDSYYMERIQSETLVLTTQSLFLLISMLVLIWFISRQIYHPVYELRVRMEQMGLDNLPFPEELPDDADEIQMFHHVFASMMKRIQKQNDLLVQQKIRELEVAYQALQSQINPHFLHNTLYLIGLKGEEHDAPEIMDMCSYLTHMTAYCTGAQEETVLLSQEAAYMEYYLQLMKYRYLDMLEYHIQISDSLKTLSVPKFILQPLVENCFTHGFKNCPKPHFCIQVSIQEENGQCVLLIEDNGNGFSPEDCDRIAEDIQFVKQSVDDPNPRFVNHISGIGLVNTYARLYIRFHGAVTLDVGRSSLDGGLVKLTAPLL